MDKKSMMVIGVAAGAIAYHFGIFQKIVSNIKELDFSKAETNFSADSGVASAPLAVNRDVGSVSQVMTDVGELNGQAHGQNARNFGVSGSHGLTPGLEAFIDRATVISFGQNFDGRSVGLN
jgi:hypothetical protein